MIKFTGTDRIPHDRAITRAINSIYKLHNDKVKGLPKCTILIAGLSPQTKEVPFRIMANIL